MKSILLEDCKITRLALETTLKFELNYDLEYSGSKDELTVDKLENADIIFVDFYLTGANGQKVRKIKEICPQIKIIVLFCEKNKEEYDEMYNFGADACIMKDIEAKKLKDIINALFLGCNCLEDEIERDEVLNNTQNAKECCGTIFEVA